MTDKTSTTIDVTQVLAGERDERSGRPHRTSFGYGPDQQRWVKRRHAAAAPFKLQQQYLYGSSRLGEVVRELPLQAGVQPPDAFGLRRYELTNHLGNVVTVIGEETTDYTNMEGRTYSVPEVVAHRDYFAFGLELNRQAEENHAARGGVGLRVEPYRFAFNGKELDNQGEWGSSTTAYDYGFRIYNPQVARFLSVDPLSPDYPWYTPYQFAGNTPIQAIDLDGLEPFKHAYLFANIDDPKLNVLHAQNIIDMTNAPSGSISSWTSLGSPRARAWFWEQYTSTPIGKEALSQKNLSRIVSGQSPRVDKQWNSVMERFGIDGEAHEVIEHHHMNKQSSAVPVPASKHTTDLHRMSPRSGPINQTSNNTKNASNRYDRKTGSAWKRFSGKLGGIATVLKLAPLVTDSPNSPLYMFLYPGQGQPNRAYASPISETGVAPYYEWSLVGESIRKVEYYNDYEMRDGEWRGAGEPVRTDYYDSDGQQTTMN